VKGIDSLGWMDVDSNDGDVHGGGDDDANSVAYGFHIDNDQRFDYPRVGNLFKKQSSKHKGAAKEQRYVLASGATSSSPNSFWCDWAKHLMNNMQQQQQQQEQQDNNTSINTKANAFLSVHFVEATSCFTEAVLALSLLDLPMQQPTQHKGVLPIASTSAGGRKNEEEEKKEKETEGLTTIAATDEPMLVYYQDMDAQLPDSHYASVAGAGLIVTQTIFDKDAFVTGENTGNGSIGK
jgi:hypothetical protein